MRPAAEDHVEIFEEVRPRLRALAYRMLGSTADAEDAVQESFLRWHRSALHDEIESPVAWLTATCTRICIDQLRSARSRRETYPGPWLPEPVVARAEGDPSEPVELADSLSTAFLLMLERLSPLERAAFLLHDVFDYSYPEIAGLLGRSETACRQLVSRARRNVRRERPRYEGATAHATELLRRFLGAARAGDVEGLVGILADDAELWSDGGGEVSAARNVLHGTDRVARFLAGVASRGKGGVLHFTAVNGAPGVVFTRDDRVVGTLAVEVTEDDRIRRVYIVVNPRKLGRIAVPGASTAPGS